MLFHHFTCLEHLAAIHAEGLSKGDVPITRNFNSDGVNAVWLTTSPRPVGHGLDGGAADKTRVCLSVDLPLDDPRLKRWRDWAPANGVTTDWYSQLNRTAGGGAATWWVYFGVIRATALTLKDMRAQGVDHLAVEWKRKAMALPGLGG
jgi:hypothetical protein